jgi:hypothetical protein
MSQLRYCLQAVSYVCPSLKTLQQYNSTCWNGPTALQKSSNIGALSEGLWHQLHKSAATSAGQTHVDIARKEDRYPITYHGSQVKVHNEYVDEPCYKFTDYWTVPSLQLQQNIPQLHNAYKN